ncbi:hypothetical protein OsJ_08984 [Oryza sativa Japonica Group]|uniref:Uncharacterized protein n=2 Tax=Oryza sativa subsp. japonica TaxID=39947 RepID=B9F4N8_ORYSJ|nr:hypothetical protein OsJ_08984 [Oryza sativa Japonica Group]
MARAGGHGMGNPVNVGIAVQADWENREFISNISLNVRRLFDFLLRFEATTKSKLASLNEKLDILERKLEVLEVQPSSFFLYVLTAAVLPYRTNAASSDLGRQPSRGVACSSMNESINGKMNELFAVAGRAGVAMMNMVSSSSIQPGQIHSIWQRRQGGESRGRYVVMSSGSVRKSSSSRRRVVAVIRAVGDGAGESTSGKDEEEEEKRRREELERLVGGPEDATFSGADLAALIRSKYGRSYDVTLIKKEFMGRNLLAMNVMWKYREQRSFPLTEEEYLLRLDDVAASLRCWGAVAHVRSSLAKLKDRPRIGKAVSIFIDMPTDDSGARSNEWIYK